MVDTRPRALIVDDWAGNRKALAWIVERGGYRCDMAVSGPNAITALGRSSYDLVVTDLNLGGDWDGEVTVKRIRDAAPTIEIIALATDSSPETARAIEALQVELMSRSHFQATFLDMRIPFEERVAAAVEKALDAKIRPIMAKAGMVRADGAVDYEALGEAIARASKRRRLLGEFTDEFRKKALMWAAAIAVAATGMAIQWMTGHFWDDIKQAFTKGTPR